MTLDLLAPDQSTVLFDFTSTTGSGNPNTLVTRLGAGLDWGDVDVGLLLRPGQYGAGLLSHSHPPVQAMIPLMASAATDDDLWAGLGQLARYLNDAAEDHPVYLKWSDLTATYYYDVIGLVSFPQIVRGTPSGSLASGRKSTLGPVMITVLRQPWRRGATVTTSADTVEGDPSAGTPDQSRIAALTVTGDLPTPGKVRVQIDASPTPQVGAILIGHRARKSHPASMFADYLTDTGWFNCESSGRNWTITLSSAASSANGAAVQSTAAHFTTNQTQFIRRVRATRTTALDSLRGSWIPYVRMAHGTVGDVWDVQLRWGLGTTDPVEHAESVYEFAADASSGYTDFVEIPLGRIDIPPNVTIGGLAVELWAGRTSGSGSMYADIVDFWPADDIARAIVSGEGSVTTTRGKNLSTAVTSPGGGTAGTPAGHFLLLDDTTDNCGFGTNSGTVFAAGQWIVQTKVSNASFVSATVDVGVRDVTAGNYEVALATQTLAANETRVVTQRFTADGSSAFQPQVDNPSADVVVQEISVEYVPALVADQSAQFDPGRATVNRLDSTGNMIGTLALEGPTPVLLLPGDNHLKVRADEVIPLGYSEYGHVLGRDPVVTVTYDPRYAV